MAKTVAFWKADKENYVDIKGSGKADGPFQLMAASSHRLAIIKRNHEELCSKGGLLLCKASTEGDINNF